MTSTKMNIRIGLSALASASMLIAAPAQAQTSDRDAALASLLDSFTRAQREYDQPKLEALTTPDYAEVSPVGDVDTREEMLGFYTPDKKQPAPKLAISERLVRLQGNVAIILARLSFDAPGPGGTARTVAMRASFVARRTGRTWRLASAQYTPIRSQN